MLLHDEVIAKLGNDAVMLDRRLVNLEQDATGVTLSFRTDTGATAPDIRASVVVACDGISPQYYTLTGRPMAYERPPQPSPPTRCLPAAPGWLSDTYPQALEKAVRPRSRISRVAVSRDRDLFAASMHVSATVDDERLACDKVAIRRGEEGNGANDVFWRLLARQWPLRAGGGAILQDLLGRLLLR
jgi:hypothetical protein